ncbi:MAG: NAD(P)/FAD-dependent oxidoreductase [Hyphomonadaceae bacterium]
MNAAGLRRVVVVGAGQAGGEAVQRLRAGDPDLEITLIGEEPLPPYQRPPLSKKYLAGELDTARLMLRPPEVYEHERIAFLPNRRAVWIDRAGKRVRLDGGQELAYDALILATGSRPRKLPLAGADLAGVHLFRTAADVDAMRPHFKTGANLVVIGAGYIGLEVAAVARTLGLDVMVLEAAVRPLARVTSPEVAGFFLDEHVAKGVRFSLNTQAAVIKGVDRVRAVGLADGSELPADLVVVGIGIYPEASLAQHSGLEVDDGIIVDKGMRTSDPAIYAIGDCVKRPLVHFGNRLGRLESVHNAIEGAKIAAAGILCQPAPIEEAPWFWSDQFDLKLQIAGLFSGYDTQVFRGDPKERAFAAFYYQAGRLIAVDAVNRPAEFLGAKQLIQRGKSVAPDALADMSKSMKEIVAAA